MPMTYDRDSNDDSDGEGDGDSDGDDVLTVSVPVALGIVARESGKSVLQTCQSCPCRSPSMSSGFA